MVAIDLTVCIQTLAKNGSERRSLPGSNTAWIRVGCVSPHGFDSSNPSPRSRGRAIGNAPMGWVSNGMLLHPLFSRSFSDPACFDASPLRWAEQPRIGKGIASRYGLALNVHRAGIECDIEFGGRTAADSKSDRAKLHESNVSIHGFDFNNALDFMHSSAIWPKREADATPSVGTHLLNHNVLPTF